MARLKTQYQQEVAPALMKKFDYKSVMQVPRIDKIVVNVGCGEARENAKVLDAVVSDLSTITGQHAVITKAKKSVANFKVREGMPVGAKVTLRGEKMWEFLDRLFNVALPRVRDFRGINPNAFDGRGNYAPVSYTHLDVYKRQAEGNVIVVDELNVPEIKTKTMQSFLTAVNAGKAVLVTPEVKMCIRDRASALALAS